MDFRPVNITLDIFCTIICILLVGYLMRSPDRKERLNRIFILICLGNMGMLLGDLPNWLCEGFARPWFPAALWAGAFLQYLCGAWLPIAYSEYLAAYLTSKYRIRIRCFSIVRVLGVISSLFVIWNLFNGMYYYMDQNNVYHRGSWWWLSQFLAIMVLLTDMGVVFAHRRHMTARAVRSFLFYIFMPIPAIAAQSVFYGLTFTYPATTLAIIIIFLNIQADQALLVEQKEKELVQNRMDIMLSQIQPHFLYNTLTAIAQLCRKDPAKAEETTVAFSGYLRANMNSLTRKKPVPFEAELYHTKTYLFLEKIRFGDELTVVYDIRASQFALPVLTIQPLVENAVKHGVGKKEDGGTVTLSTRETDGEYLIIIADDGVGFDSTAVKREDGPHIGIDNVRRRIETLTGGSLEVASSVGAGTTATVRIPKEGNKIEDHFGG